MSTLDTSVHKPLDAAVRACKRHFAAAAGFSAAVNLLYLAPTIYMLQVYDRVVPTNGLLTLAFLTLVFVFATATLSYLDHIRSKLLVRASVRLDRLLSGRILSAILSQVGVARSSAALREFDILRQAMTGPGALALFDAPWTPIYILICFLLHPALGGLALVGCVLLTALAYFNERATKAPLTRANEAATRSYGSLDTSAQASGVLRALGMRGAMVQRHQVERHASIHLQAEASFAAADFMTWTKFTRLLLQSLALGLGAYLAINQQISAGAIFAASLLVTRALSPIEQVLGAWKGVVQARAAWSILADLFDKAEAARVHTHLPAPEGMVSLERVSVANPERNRLLLSDVSFVLQPGESLGIVGPSGAGKSTLARVIAGATPLANGAVRFDNADMKDWDDEYLARHIGYVPQDPTLFMGTVKENIARFRSFLDDDLEALDDEVVKAAKACGAHELILRLPQGYDTQLGWAGAGLSAGQAQRIALARAFFGEPSIIIMDEPNAHLDAEGEGQLIEALARLKARKVTVMIVAHRTGILASIDKLLILRDGKVEIMGNRDEVTRKLAAGRAPPIAANPGRSAPAPRPAAASA